jgi:hypothetical protein
MKKDKTLNALEAVHAALKPLTPEDRQRVLSSVRALLGDTFPLADSPRPKPVSEVPLASTGTLETGPTASRKTSIRELIQDKKPASHPELITLFGYYREKYENKPNFARADLQPYYLLSKETPPGNYDRDFVNAVKKGWVHEENESSYVTSKGIEAVESGFAASNGRQPRAGSRTKSKIQKPRKSAKRRTT